MSMSLIHSLFITCHNLLSLAADVAFERPLLMGTAVVSRAHTQPVPGSERTPPLGRRNKMMGDDQRILDDSPQAGLVCG